MVGTRAAHLPDRRARRRVARRRAGARAARGHCVHTILVGLDQRPEGRGTDPREHPREQRRRDAGRGLRRDRHLARLDAAHARHGADRLSPVHDVRGCAPVPDADRPVRAARVALDEVRIGQAGDRDLLAELRLPAFPARARRQDARRRRLEPRADHLQRRRADLGRARRGVPRAPGAERSAPHGDVAGLRPRGGDARRDDPGARIRVSHSHGRSAIAGARASRLHPPRPRTAMRSG